MSKVPPHEHIWKLVRKQYSAEGWVNVCIYPGCNKRKMITSIQLRELTKKKEEKKEDG